MSTDQKVLDVSIMGREFRIACQEDERQGLLESVAYLDRRMREIKDNGKVVGIERIARMAALNITHELLTTRVGGGFDMGDLMRRIASLQAVVEQAMTEQEELF